MRHVRLPLAIVALVAIAACGGGKSSSNAGSNGDSNAGSAMGSPGAAAQNMPNCGAVQPVWVNTRSGKYHEPGDPAYGHTKVGEYLCPAQAKQQGYVLAGAGQRRRHRHAHRYQSGGAESGNSAGSDTDNSNP